MKRTALIFLSTSVILTSLWGQTAGQKDTALKKDVTRVTGDTVKELGKNIMVVYQDKKNVYWFGSWETGLYRYDGKTMLHFTTQHGLPDNRVEEIKEDKQGNIYLNTSKGVCRYNKNGFLKLTEAISSGNDWKLHPDDLWFKNLAHSGSVYRFDGNDLYRLKLPTTKLGEDYKQQHPNYPDPYAVYCIYKDNKQNIWFGTSTLGVCRYNGKLFDWISESDVTELHEGPANGVRSITEDKNGQFWFNTDFMYTVYDSLSPERKTFYQRHKSMGSLDGKKNGTLKEYLSSLRDNNNNLWFATYRDGVWKYDGTKITHYSVQLNSEDVTVFSIYKDNAGKLWLGTHENGVFKFNGKDFEKFAL